MLLFESLCWNYINNIVNSYNIVLCEGGGWNRSNRFGCDWNQLHVQHFCGHIHKWIIGYLYSILDSTLSLLETEHRIFQCRSDIWNLHNNQFANWNQSKWNNEILVVTCNWIITHLRSILDGILYRMGKGHTIYRNSSNNIELYNEWIDNWID